MRRVWIVLLIALTCFRAWAGEAMAGQMLAHELAGAQPAVAVAAMQDCPHHAAVQDDGVADPSGCSGCAQCDACSLHALTAVAPSAFPAALEAHAQAAPVPYHSVDAPRGHKPPIG
jgi:hypothetical protein